MSSEVALEKGAIINAIDIAWYFSLTLAFFNTAIIISAYPNSGLKLNPRLFPSEIILNNKMIS